MDVLGLPAIDGRLQLIDLMVHLSGVHNCSTVLVEAGPGLLSALLQEQLINDAMVFVAPMLLGDADGLPALKGFTPETVQDAADLRLRSMHRRGDDVLLHYGVSSDSTTSP